MLLVRSVEWVDPLFVQNESLVGSWVLRKVLVQPLDVLPGGAYDDIRGSYGIHDIDYALGALKRPLLCREDTPLWDVSFRWGSLEQSVSEAGPEVIGQFRAYSI